MAVSRADGAVSARGRFMATQPKAQDPTAAALSAIEEALNLAQIAEPTPPKAETPKAPAVQPTPARMESEADLAARTSRRQRDEAESRNDLRADGRNDIKADPRATEQKPLEPKGAAAPA